jgi:hypothetical protein
MVAFCEITNLNNQDYVLSDLGGAFCIHAKPDDTLQFFAFGYEVMTLVASDVKNQIAMTLKNDILHEVIIIDRNQTTRKLKEKKSKIIYQGVVGSVFLKSVSSECPYQIDSVELFISDVIRETNYIEIVAFDKSLNQIGQSQPFSFTKAHIGKMVSIPTDFAYEFKDTNFIGIRFLEDGKNEYNAKKHLYQYRKEGLLTPQNNGVSFGGFESQFKIEKKFMYRSTLGGRYQAFHSYRSRKKPSITIYYRADCKLTH